MLETLYSRISYWYNKNNFWRSSGIVVQNNYTREICVCDLPRNRTVDTQTDQTYLTDASMPGAELAVGMKMKLHLSECVVSGCLADFLYTVCVLVQI